MPTVPRGFSGGAGGVVGFRVLNAPKVIADIQRYGTSTTSKVRIAIKRGLVMFEAESKRLVAGNVYWKNPIDTRRMSNSITHHLDKFTYTKIEGRFGLNSEYAFYVHEGTKLMEIGAANSGESFLEKGKRPFLVDALMNMKDLVIADVIKAYTKELYR